MTKEAIKEIGKLFFDAAKIIFAVAILTPLVKGSEAEIIPFISATASVLIGIILINKGTKDE